MSTKVYRAMMRDRAKHPMHMVDGYGGAGWCGKPWGGIVAATVKWRLITCPACNREHDRVWASHTPGIRRTRSGAWAIGGRRYRSRRLALCSTLPRPA